MTYVHGLELRKPPVYGKEHSTKAVCSVFQRESDGETNTQKKPETSIRPGYKQIYATETTRWL